MKMLKVLALPFLALGLAAVVLAGEFGAVAAGAPSTDGVPTKAVGTDPTTGAVNVATWHETDITTKTGNPGGHPNRQP